MKEDKMKSVLFSIIIGAVADLPFAYLPKVSLLAVMCGAMVADFILAIVRAKLAGEKITSKGLTKSVIKFCQYGGAIAIGLTISYLSLEVGKFNDTWKYTPQFMSVMNNTMIVFMISIEIKSCVRHLINMDKKSEVSTKILAPALKVLSVKFKDNPIVETIVEADEDEEVKFEISQKTIKSKNIIN